MLNRFWADRFNRLWLGQSISQVGTSISGVAIPLTAVLVIHASPFEFSLLGVARFLPWIFVALPAGVMVDRYRRQAVLIRADLARALILGAIPLAALAGWLSMPWLLAAALGAGVASVFFDVAYLSFLPALVERTGLRQGNAKLEASRAAGAVAGEGMAGVLVSALTAPFAIALDALSYLASALAIRSIPVVERARPAAPPQLLRELRAGLALVWSDRRLRLTTGSATTVNFARWIWASLFILYASGALAISPIGIGLIFASGSLATVLGARLTHRYGERLGNQRALLLGMGGIVVCPLLIPLAPVSPFALPILALAYAGTNGLAVVWDITCISLRQQIAGEAAAGRVNATARFLMYGLAPTAGALTGGVLASLLGLQAAIWVGVLTSFAALLWLRGLPRWLDGEPAGG